MPDYNYVIFNDLILLDEPIDYLMDILSNKKLDAASYIVTPNVDHFFRLSQGESRLFLDAYDNADIRVCDSRIIKKLSLLERKSISNVIPGSDLTRNIFESSWIREFKILIIGSSHDQVSYIKNKYCLDHITYFIPPIGFLNDNVAFNECVDFVSKSDADLVFLAVGSPQQEILANAVKKRCVYEFGFTGVMLCVGASIDFLSCKTKRAPYVIQFFHLEWLHRAFQDPVRLVPRYLKNFKWVASYMVKKLKSLK